MIHQRSIVYNIQWCKSKIFRGLRPLDPRQGLCPCTPPGALRRAPGPHPKSARAYALAMCAPRTCLPPKKNRLALTRSLCALRAHVCPPKKKSARAYALAMCAPRTCLPNPPPNNAFSEFCRYIWKFVATCKPTSMSFVPTKYLKYQQNIERNSSFRM